MVGTLENIRATLEKCRGIIEIVFIWWKGLFENIMIKEGFFCKRPKGGGTIN